MYFVFGRKGTGLITRVHKVLEDPNLRLGSRALYVSEEQNLFLMKRGFLLFLFAFVIVIVSAWNPFPQEEKTSYCTRYQTKD